MNAGYIEQFLIPHIGLWVPTTDVYAADLQSSRAVILEGNILVEQERHWLSST